MQGFVVLHEKNIEKFEELDEKTIVNQSSVSERSNSPSSRDYENINSKFDEITSTLAECKEIFSRLFENILISHSNQNEINLSYKNLERFEKITKKFYQIHKDAYINYVKMNEFNISENVLKELSAFNDLNVMNDNYEQVFKPMKMGGDKFYGSSTQNGFGLVHYSCNEFYIGHLKDEKRHGTGVYIWKNGSVCYFIILYNIP